MILKLDPWLVRNCVARAGLGKLMGLDGVALKASWGAGTKGHLRKLTLPMLHQVKREETCIYTILR